MNKKYTLEDVEFIRAKAYVTYEEAIGLLDAYEGDVVRVMAELERSGKLKNAKGGESTAWETIKSVFRKGYEHRMIIRKDNRDICNFSVIFWIVVTVFAPYVVIPAVVIALIFGYRITFRNEEGSAKDFYGSAYTAKENIKKAASSIRDEFSNAQQNHNNQQNQNGQTYQNDQSQSNQTSQNSNQQPVNPQPANQQPYVSNENAQNSDIIIE